MLSFDIESIQSVTITQAMGVGILLLDQLVKIVDKAVMNKFKIWVVLPSKFQVFARQSEISDPTIKLS